MATHLLFETASGYALFERKQSEEVTRTHKEAQKSIVNPKLFKKMVSIKSFAPFESAQHALENSNSVSEGALHPFLKNFLEVGLSGVKNVVLGVYDSRIGNAITEALSIECIANETVLELLRGVRLHFESFLDELKEKDLEAAQLGLGHSYSRSKVKFNINRNDNMIIQSIALLENLDKDINTFSMRAREWYGWHFPELNKIVKDIYVYVALVKAIKSKSTVNEERLEEITEIVDDEATAKQIIEAAKSSMGTELSDIDMISIESFCNRVLNLRKYRENLNQYLITKMDEVAPNLAALVGELVGARLISHAGSLTNLAKYPASTIQILGAEKALFRALKSRGGKTPKYGLLFHTSFIGRSGSKFKGRISRYLANKVAMAARIDAFSDTPNRLFGEKLKEQVEDRIAFYEQGTVPKKNVEVMHEAQMEVDKDQSKKRKISEMEIDSDGEEDESSDDEEVVEPPKKKAKKSKDEGKEKKKEKKDKKKDKKEKKEKKKDKKEKKEKKKAKKDKKEKKKKKSKE